MIEKAKMIVRIDIDRQENAESYRRKKYMEYFEDIWMDYVRKYITHIPMWLEKQVSTNYWNQWQAFAEVVVKIQWNNILDNIIH